MQRDIVPAIDKAAFVQVKKKIGRTLGIQAWYLRSQSDDTVAWLSAHGNGNDFDRFDSLAHVLGAGFVWQLGPKGRLSFDYGQNRTAFGRFLNGRSIYDHQRGTADFTLLGRRSGGTPHFWTIRYDVGHSDMDKPGSWNAFIDYKYFQHGSFFGGNGTDAVPDRYLDGIRSFTAGAGYVPARNFFIEVFYTFYDKGINKHDTLYGPEQFKLGDYTRVQLTYRF